MYVSGKKQSSCPPGGTQRGLLPGCLAPTTQVYAPHTHKNPPPPPPPPCSPSSVAGPTLAARYLVPALVDCLGRLVTTAAVAASEPATARYTEHSKACPTTTWRPDSDSTTTAPTPPPPPSPPERGSELNTNNVDVGGIDRAAAPPPPPRSAGATAGHRRPVSRGDGELRGCRVEDPVSAALLRYCRTRGATEEFPDVGAGGGTPFLVLSRALGEMCLQVREVVQRGGTGAKAGAGAGARQGREDT